MKKKLYKSESNRFLCGVCSGIADFFNCDPTIVRLIFVLLCFLKGVGIIFYIIAAIIMPSENTKPEDKTDEGDVSEMKSANIEKHEKITERKINSTEAAPHSDEEFNSYFQKK